MEACHLISFGFAEDDKTIKKHVILTERSEWKDPNNLHRVILNEAEEP